MTLLHLGAITPRLRICHPSGAGRFIANPRERQRKKLLIVAAASIAACMASVTIAADKNAGLKAANTEYKTAVAKAKSDFDKAIANCKKLAEDQQSACYKEARHVRRQARDEASDAYTKATGRPEPSPGA